MESVVADKSTPVEDDAIVNDEFFLAMRLNIASRSMCTVIDPLISDCSRNAYELLEQYICDILVS